MKKINLKSIIAIAACFAMIATSSVSVFAADGEFESGGNAGFEKGGKVDPVDPTDPKNPLGPGGGTGDDKELSLDYVPNFYFGKTLKIDKNKTVNEFPHQIAKMQLGTLAKEDYQAPFIQVSDDRGAGKYVGWKISVASSDFKVKASSDSNDIGKVLEGARILIAPGTNISFEGNKNPAADIRSGELILEAGGSAKPIFTAQANTFGTWVNRMFDPVAAKADLDAGKVHMNDMVKLSVATSKIIPGASYESTMKWVRSNAPG